MKRLTTMQQANRHLRAGDTLYCSYPGVSLAVVEHIRYGQGAFQAKVVGRDEWVDPSRVWVKVLPAAEKQGVPTLWDMPAAEEPGSKKTPENPCIQAYGPGPDGKQCKDCALIVGICHARIYYKCRLRKFTNGPTSDHKRRYPACAKFEQRENGDIPLYNGR